MVSRRRTSLMYEEIYKRLIFQAPSCLKYSIEAVSLQPFLGEGWEVLTRWLLRSALLASFPFAAFPCTGWWTMGTDRRTLSAYVLDWRNDVAVRAQRCSPCMRLKDASREGAMMQPVEAQW